MFGCGLVDHVVWTFCHWMLSAYCTWKLDWTATSVTISDL